MIAKSEHDNPRLERALQCEAALRRSWRELLVQHQREGHPMIVWRDGRVQEIDPAELEREANGSAQ